MADIQLNQICLEKKDMTENIAALNQLLSTYHIFYLNARGYHWNVRGEHFFSLHTKFEELYTELQLQIDEIAERILTLGGRPFHAYSDFTQHSRLNEDKNVIDGVQCVKGVVGGLQTIVTQQREIAELAEKNEDQGTSDLLAEYVQQQEKLIWMYNAFLG
ncbi:Dps family protein [Alkanindiges sp. WGS2144]|uniref:Dps family protein n=1 Tax=Alkanindiges sp. WGS2144 TaxID=3366808 RepID=UPI003753AD07